MIVYLKNFVKFFSALSGLIHASISNEFEVLMQSMQIEMFTFKTELVDWLRHLNQSICNCNCPTPLNDSAPTPTLAREEDPFQINDEDFNGFPDFPGDPPIKMTPTLTEVPKPKTDVQLLTSDEPKMR